MGVQLEALKEQSKQAADRAEEEKINLRIADLELVRERLERAIEEDS